MTPHPSNPRPAPEAGAPALDGPPWQTVGRRARALAELLGLRPPDEGPARPSAWPRRLAWAHHGVCLGLVLTLVIASLLALAGVPAGSAVPPDPALRPGPGGARVIAAGPLAPPHRAGVAHA